MADATASVGPCPCPNPPPLDPNAHMTAQLMAIGNLSMQQAVENSGRLSAMFGVRSAQSNPVEATSIASLKQADAPNNAQSNAIAASLMTLVSALANLAHVTPATQAPPTQVKSA